MQGSLLTDLITRFMRLQDRLSLPAYSGEYFTSPAPPYLSQFVDLYPSSIDLDTPLTNPNHLRQYGAKDSEEFTFWAWRNCGIACVKMILESRQVAQQKTIMDLTKAGIALGGYLLYEGGSFVDKGWFHHALASLLQQYGVPAHLKRWQSIDSVAKDILENKSVILSVMVPGRHSIQEDGSFRAKPGGKYGGHLLLATGVKMKDKKVKGLYVHDPRGLPNYQANTYIPAKTFNQIFTSRTIVAFPK